jgi:hypothetical protein
VSGGVIMCLLDGTDHICNLLDILLLVGRYFLDTFSIPSDVVAGIHSNLTRLKSY